jgi:type I restriction enzyme, R subunit
MDTSEKSFETAIVAALTADPSAVTGGPRGARETARVATGGYRERSPADYDRALCLDPGAALDFVYATQPQEWARLQALHREDARERFLRRLASEVAKRGTLDVLRKGIRESGCKLQLAYFRPASGLNSALQRLYDANQFTVIRQLRYGERGGQSLDLALFLNGLSIPTASSAARTAPSPSIGAPPSSTRRAPRAATCSRPRSSSPSPRSSAS